MHFPRATIMNDSRLAGISSNITANSSAAAAKLSFLCYRANGIPSSSGIWNGDDPLDFSIPLLLAQIVIIFAISTAIHAIFRHLGQPPFISHVVAGIVLSPSLLSRYLPVMEWLFPLRGWVILDIVSVLACMLFIFVMGVKTDIGVVRASGKKGLAIAELGTFFPFVASLLVSFSIHPPSEVTPAFGSLLLQTMIRWAITSNSVLTCLLNDLNLLTSRLGRLAMSASLISDLQYFVFSMVASSVAVGASMQQSGKIFSVILAFTVFTGVIVLVMRPLVLWMIRRTPEGETMDEAHFLTVLMMALACGMIGGVIGHNVIIGPLMLGLVLPGGPPLGTTLTDRLERFVSGLFLPAYMVSVGLRTQLNLMGKGIDWGFIVAVLGVSTVVKFGAVLAVCRLYCRMPVRDSIVVSLMMSCRGIVELHTIRMWYDSHFMDEHFYSLTVLWILVVGGLSASLLKLLYNPSIRFAADKCQTVDNTPRSVELRILACVHQPENVPPLLALLNSNSSPHGAIHRAPLSFYLLLLVPLIGRTTGVLAPYDDKNCPHHSSTFDAIINVFRSLQWTLPSLSINPFLAASPYVTMHEDVCHLATDQQAVLIILPFHKHNSNGIECSNTSIRSMNTNVLRYAPCSVSILVDRRVVREKNDNADACHVAVLFLGGADDREALACGIRMADNPTVRLVVIRILPPVELRGAMAAVAKDEEAVDELMEMAVSDRVVYVEETVADGSEMVKVLRKLCENCLLLIVGRREGEQTTATAGLEEWREYPELGVIGDMMAEVEFGAKVLTLVVQQHKGKVKGEKAEDGSCGETNAADGSLGSSRCRDRDDSGDGDTKKVLVRGDKKSCKIGEDMS